MERMSEQELSDFKGWTLLELQFYVEYVGSADRAAFIDAGIHPGDVEMRLMLAQRKIDELNIQAALPTTNEG